MSIPCTDVELERQYVSTILRYPDPEHLSSADRLSPLDLSAIAHARIAEAVHAVFVRPGGEVCEAEVATELERAGAKTAIATLRELAKAGLDLGSAKHQAKRLRTLAAARRRREAALRLAAALESGNEDAEREFSAELTGGAAQSESVQFEALADSAVNAVGDLVKAPDRAKWRTGFPIIDDAIGGCPPGTLHVVGGRTGAGKSSYALAIALHQARNGLRPGIVSVEDPDTLWGPRALAHVCDINPEGFYTGKFNAGFMNEIEAGEVVLRRLGVQMAYALNRPLHDVVTAVRGLVISGCNTIVVDYVQAIQMDGRVDRKVSVADAARDIKRTCQALGVTLTLLSQLTRPPNAKPFAEPHMNELKETGDLENISEVITLLWKTSDAESAQAHGKIAKVKWSSRRPRFNVERHPQTGAITALSHRVEEPAGEASTIPSIGRGHGVGARW